jgi:hypothetical protein
MVRGCEFRENKPQIELLDGVRRAVITGNLITGATRIKRPSASGIQIGENAADSP